MEIRQFQTADLTPALRAQLDQLIQDSFPPAQRQPFREFLQAVDDGYYHLFLGLQAQNLVGFAAVNDLDCGSVFLLAYLAVDPQTRSGGYGGQLLAFVQAYLCAQGVRAMLLEIEAVAEASLDPSDPRRRRLAFYQRHGARLLDFPYRAPDLSDPQAEQSLAMDLLWLPCTDQAPVPSRDELRICVRSIYLGDYGLSHDHPLVTALNRL